MTTKNDITGHSIVSRANSKAFSNNFDRIFGNKDKKANDKLPNEQREILASGDGSASGVDGEGDDFGDTNLEHDGGVK